MITQRKKIRKAKAFTIVELLTVMSVIIILIGLLVPALNEVRRYAKDVRQNAQMHSINVAIELYEKEFEEYPPSSRFDGDGSPGTEYCGAMKLAEAMVGQDLLGFHPDSLFRANLQDDNGDWLYTDEIPAAVRQENYNSRKPPYLQLEQANATKLKNIYSGTAISGSAFSSIPSPHGAENIFVLCDVYTRRMSGDDGLKHGMPILYYKANISGNVNPNKENNYAYDIATSTERRIYLYEDNDDLVRMNGTEAVPWDTTVSNMKHYMSSDNTSGPGNGPLDFYWRINNDNIEIEDGRPYRSDSYILLSAGSDGLYGTRDDIYNFQKK